MARTGFGVRGWGLGNVIALGLLLSTNAIILSAAPQATNTGQGPRITVRIFDYAGIGARTLQAASKEAASILGKTGLATDWQFCDATGGPMPPICNQPLEPDQVAVRIVRRAKQRNGALGCTECGTAFEDSQGLGAYANLYADCLKTLPSVDGLLPSAMLGHLLAHEIGHLLLPGKDHARQGVMRPQMRDEDWKLAAVGALVFPPRQAALLRAEVASRQRRAEAAVAARAERPR